MAVSVGLAFGQAANALVVTSFSVIPTTVAPGGNFTITQNITCAGPTATIVLTDHSGNPAGQLVVNDGAGVWPGTVASSAAPGLATFTEYCNDQGSSTAQTVGTLTVTLTTE
ncbi:MAG TPA: hypothetical protein VN793_02830, partial [Acidimicrobiales bacterium]|nr:hypothetical protein [Acidimicrobiales bacterium]